jgi:hypothetical protein
MKGFPTIACEALDEHEANYKERPPQSFNVAANYLEATEQALQCKLKACSHVLLDEALGEELKNSALEVLLDPNDPMALQHSIRLLVKKGLIGAYADRLIELCNSPHLAKLSLDLPKQGLTGTSS